MSVKNFRIAKPRRSSVVAHAALAILAFMLMACDNTQLPEQDSLPPLDTKPTESVEANYDTIPPAINVEHGNAPLTTRYLLLATQQFDAMCLSSGDFQTSIQQFLSTPTEETLNKARSHWINTHSHFAATQLFRYLDIQHPVLDHSTIEPVQHSLSTRIDQSPLLPGYIDAVEGYPQSGFIFSPLPIDRETLNQEHQFTDALYVTLGFHAIEFLLWGEQVAEKAARLSTDFASLDIKDAPSHEDSLGHAKWRRSQLLSLTTEILVSDLATLCREWQPHTGYYPAQLLALPAAAQTMQINQTIKLLLQDLEQSKSALLSSVEVNASSGPHSRFAGSDTQDRDAKIRLLKSLLASEEWSETEKHQEQSKQLTKAAAALSDQIN